MYIITMYMYILKSIPIFRTEIKLLKPLDNCAKDIGPTMKNCSISNVKNCFCIYNVRMIFFFNDAMFPFLIMIFVACILQTVVGD